jgi:hypothetical protein
VQGVQPQQATLQVQATWCLGQQPARCGQIQSRGLRACSSSECMQAGAMSCEQHSKQARRAGRGCTGSMLAASDLDQPCCPSCTDRIRGHAAGRACAGTAPTVAGMAARESVPAAAPGCAPRVLGEPALRMPVGQHDRMPLWCVCGWAALGWKGGSSGVQHKCGRRWVPGQGCRLPGAEGAGQWLRTCPDLTY